MQLLYFKFVLASIGEINRSRVVSLPLHIILKKIISNKRKRVILLYCIARIRNLYYIQQRHFKQLLSSAIICTRIDNSYHIYESSDLSLKNKNRKFHSQLPTSKLNMHI